ncbi:MAG: hypothetical protein ACR2QF_14440 [Geminicoccaceae bacterium]
MKSLTQIVDQIADDQAVATPDLVKVDVQVRTSGVILPPSWLKPATKRGTAEPSKA